ncbi:MAG: hypothetical protein M3Q30_08130 [Actinomycetota bacterium]|nr:hypothetical protein [Actinomycetota bacterium]
MRRRPWDEEANAAEIVCAQLGGVAHQIDTGGGPEQLHDFDVELPDGTMVAVEVTRHNVPLSLGVLAELDKRDWHFPELRNVWVVDMIPVYSVGLVHRQIAGLLLELETARIDRLLVRGVLFDATLHDDEIDDDEREDRELLDRTGTRATAERLRDLGARLVYCLTEAGSHGGEVIMSEAGQGGSTGPSVIIEMIERHASRPDNVKKLVGASDRSERHLFVWVETSQQAAVAAFDFSKVLPDGVGMPDRAPELPDCMDAAWAVTGFDNAHIWQYHRAYGWRDLESWRRPEQ